MPEFVEPLVSELVTSFTSYSDDERRELSSAISPEISFVLGWYARKLAGRAVRESSREDLSRGLIALAISANAADSRDVMAPLALLYNSALRLEVDPKILFEAAARTSAQPVRDRLEEFLRRLAAQKAPHAFGFEEGMGPFGFDYVPFLPEFGGPTPFQSDGPGGNK